MRRYENGLEIGDVELPAPVDIELKPTAMWESVVAAIEHVPAGERPLVKLEVYGDWGEVGAYLELDDAEQLRDRLDEVIEVAREAEQP